MQSGSVVKILKILKPLHTTQLYWYTLIIVLHVFCRNIQYWCVTAWVIMNFVSHDRLCGNQSNSVTHLASSWVHILLEIDKNQNLWRTSKFKPLNSQSILKITFHLCSIIVFPLAVKLPRLLCVLMNSPLFGPSLENWIPHPLHPSSH